MKPRAISPTAWLWWLALVILAMGGIIIFMLRQKSFDPSTRNDVSLTLLIMVIGAGICVIAATSKWWMKR